MANSHDLKLGIHPLERGERRPQKHAGRSPFRCKLLLESLLLGLAALTISGASRAQSTTSSEPAVTEITAPDPVVDVNTCPPPDGTRPDPTLINTDDFVLSRFSLERVFSHLVKLANVQRQNGSELYQQLWDSMDTKANAHFHGPHCDDTEPPSINGFPIECPRPEVSLKDSKPGLMVPVALVNRFELAPADGLNCGEYRIVYAMKPFNENDRNFIILEGVMPNPYPRRGLAACRPIVDFWESLAYYDISRPSGRDTLADALEWFYFKGMRGFGPVLEPTHLGMSGRGGYGGPNGGQIRTNMFVSGTTWQLREFRLNRECKGRSCRLEWNPVAVGRNPFPPLFDASNPDPMAAEFQGEFISQIESLSNDDVNLITMNLDERYNAGQSTSTGFNDGYLVQAINGVVNGSFTFVNAIQTELTRLGRPDISPFDITVRATTQSCAGCHQITTLSPLSFDGAGGPVWPAPRPGGFVHIDEDRFLSPALWCDFLPFRKSILDGFYRSTAQQCTSYPCFTFVGRHPRSHRWWSKPGEFTVSGKRFGPN